MVVVQDKEEEIIHAIYDCDKYFSKKKIKEKYMKWKNILVSRLNYLLIFRGFYLNTVNEKGIMGVHDPHSQVSILKIMRISMALIYDWRHSAAF